MPSMRLDVRLAKGAPKDAERPQAFSADTFSKVAGGINSLIAAIAISVGGAWALTRFTVLLEARIAEAQALKTEAEAVVAKRKADEAEIVNVDLSVQVLASKRGKRWVSVVVGLKNTGSKDYVISLENDVRFYVARVLETKSSGEVIYGDRSTLAFDYADKRLEWFNLKPGAELDSYRAIKEITVPGLYIARFSVRAPPLGARKGREYSAQTFFVVD
jgi:hypothetical protein